MARGRIAQKWPERCRQGEFISARDRNGQRSKWPEIEVTRGRIGQKLNWPGATRQSDVKASKTKVKRGTTGRSGQGREG